MKKDNVVKVNCWISSKKNREEAKSLKDYFAGLNFHDLIIEGQAIINELGEYEITSDLYMKSKYFSKEISNRLESSKDEFSGVLSELLNMTEEKIGGLGLA